KAEVFVDADARFMALMSENDTARHGLTTDNLLFALEQSRRFLMQGLDDETVLDLEKQMTPIADLKPSVEAVGDGVVRLKMMAGDKLLFSKLFPDEIDAQAAGQSYSEGLIGWNLSKTAVTPKGIQYLIYRADSTYRANIVRITPEQGGGMMGIALHVYRDGKQVFAKFRLFPQAVEEGNAFFDGLGATDSQPNDETLYGPLLTLEEGEGVFTGESPSDEEVAAGDEFVKNNIKTTVVPAPNVIPPGFKVWVYVDKRFIVEILKDQNQGGFVFTHPQAVARAKDLLEKLQGWRVVGN
ncbi:MAG: hypothetical protein ICV60_17665, partial [Pyrinomonadaceae bacterium]|nr:hypothetical protein [Pyrinomonadaceae bacterium]